MTDAPFFKSLECRGGFVSLLAVIAVIEVMIGAGS